MTLDQRLKDIAGQMTEQICGLATGEYTQAEAQFRFNGLRAEAERLQRPGKGRFARSKP